MTKIDHAAVRTAHYEEAQKFFEDVFDMHMWREIGEKPGRKCWFKEGIQLCETSEIAVSSENGYDHISCCRFCSRDHGKDQSISCYPY